MVVFHRHRLSITNRLHEHERLIDHEDCCHHCETAIRSFDFLPGSEDTQDVAGQCTQERRDRHAVVDVVRVEGTAGEVNFATAFELSHCGTEDLITSFLLVAMQPPLPWSILL